MLQLVQDCRLWLKDCDYPTRGTPQLSLLITHLNCEGGLRGFVELDPEADWPTMLVALRQTYPDLVEHLNLE